MPSSYLSSLAAETSWIKLDDQVAKLSPADLKKLVELITAPSSEAEVQFATAKAARTVAPLITDKLIGPLVKRLGSAEHLFLGTLTDAQLRAAYAWSVTANRAFRNAKPYQSDHIQPLTFELLRRGQFTAADLTAALELLATGGPERPLFEEWGNFIQLPWSSDREQAAAIAQAEADAHASLVALGAPLRAWLLSQRPLLQPKHLVSQPAMFLIGATYEPADATWLAGLYAELPLKDYGTNATTYLAEALVGRADGADVIAAIRANVKGKKLAGLFDNAAAQLASMRALVTSSAPAALDWGRTPTDKSVEVVRAAADPVGLLALGAKSTDPVALLNVWRTAHQLKHDEWSKKAKKQLAIPLATLTALIRGLAERYGDGEPDLKALGARIGGYPQAAHVFTDGLDHFLATRDDRDALRAAALEAFRSTANTRFRGWLESRVADWDPSRSESLDAKLTRLVANASGKKVSRSVVLVGGDSKINRMFAAPLKKMEHVITLETRLLSDAARLALGKDCVAVAVYLSSLRDHEAFEPHTKHASVVRLTSAASAPRGGISLDARLVDVPAAVFLGGKKTGVVAELRGVFDRSDLVTPDRPSPRWLQSPQPAGAFLFELDAAFAPRINMGDGGRLYVFADTAFVQST